MSKWNKANCPTLVTGIPLVGSSGFVYGLAIRTAHPAKQDSSSKRIYVSVGNRISLQSMKDVILKCCDVEGSYIPEPVRLADLTGRAIERAWKQMRPCPEARRMAMDISNLLENKGPEDAVGHAPGGELGSTNKAGKSESRKSEEKEVDSARPILAVASSFDA